MILILLMRMNTNLMWHSHDNHEGSHDNDDHNHDSSDHHDKFHRHYDFVYRARPRQGVSLFESVVHSYRNILISYHNTYLLTHSSLYFPFKINLISIKIIYQNSLDSRHLSNRAHVILATLLVRLDPSPPSIVEVSSPGCKKGQLFDVCVRLCARC